MDKTFLTEKDTAEYKRLIREVTKDGYNEAVKAAVYNELDKIFKLIKEKYGI